MPSIHDLDDLPSPQKLLDATRFSSMLDVILCDKDWLRSYTFHPKWSDGLSLARYDNGGGNDMYIFFRGQEAIIKGFDHESPVSPHAREKYETWPNIYKGVPAKLNELLDDPDIEREHVTFCTWYTAGKWSSGPVKFPNDEDDGSSYLLGMIQLDSDSYCEWALNYYDVELDTDAVESIYHGQIIDEHLIARINPDRDANIALLELSKMQLEY